MKWLGLLKVSLGLVLVFVNVMVKRRYLQLGEARAIQKNLEKTLEAVKIAQNIRAGGYDPADDDWLQPSKQGKDRGKPVSSVGDEQPSLDLFDPER